MSRPALFAGPSNSPSSRGLQKQQANAEKPRGRRSEEKQQGCLTPTTMCDNYHTMSKGKQTMTEALKKAIAERGLPMLRLEKLTGVKRASIMRFMQGRQSLRLDKADKLAGYFGIECRQSRRKAR